MKAFAAIVAVIVLVSLFVYGSVSANSISFINGNCELRPSGDTKRIVRVGVGGDLNWDYGNVFIDKGTSGWMGFSFSKNDPDRAYFLSNGDRHKYEVRLFKNLYRNGVVYDAKEVTSSEGYIQAEACNQ